MKIAYTVCSLNRLGQILVLKKSLLHHNPDYRFVVGLADEINGRIDVAQYPEIEFINLSALVHPAIRQIAEQYDIFELSCALKAFYGNHLMQKYQPKMLLYFDTDICIYHSFDAIEQALEQNSILLSPHYTSPLPADGKYPLERDVLNSGLYNGGFVGLKNSNDARKLLEWWQARLTDQGYNNVCEGMMVDQLWLNLVHLFFKNVKLLTHPGCNLAYWNLHEHLLINTGNKFLADDQPLVFFHFSGYRLEKPDLLSIHQNRFQLSNNAALTSLVQQYHSLLVENKYASYASLECVYGKQKPKKHHSFPKKVLMNGLANIGYKLEKIRKL